LKDWLKTGEFEISLKEELTVWECPDLVYLATSNGNSSKWVLVVNVNPGGYQPGSGVKYFIGYFDGFTFTADDPTRIADFLDYGPDFYAVTSFFQDSGSQHPVTSIPAVAWMQNWIYTQFGTYPPPTHPWRGQMSFPRSYGLRAYKNKFYATVLPNQELGISTFNNSQKKLIIDNS
jgi:fructan beta-fructosidase